MKKLLILVAFVGVLSANSLDALFATISGVASNDTLNVRAKPNWHSKKLTQLPPNSFVGVDRCVRVGRSNWCRVCNINRNLGEYHDYSQKLPGWVNAKFLKFSSRGYVAINGKKRCNYAVSCNAGRCRVVIDETIESGRVIAIKTKSYPRGVLKGIGELDIPNGSEGYSCGRLNFKIEKYLSNHTSNPKGAKATAREFLKALLSKKLFNIKSFIHPRYGILITGNKHFATYNVKFSQKRFVKFYNSSKEFVWGYSSSKGDPIKMSLKKMLHLKLPINRVSRVTTLSKLKYFKPIKGCRLKGFEFFWKGTGKASGFNWQGADIILAQIDKKWYVVGFLWNRWSV